MTEYIGVVILVTIVLGILYVVTRYANARLYKNNT